MMKFPPPSPEYALLKTWKESWGIVYGPIQSRRLGKSLGINLLGSGQKACSFDCPYCELGHTSIRMKDLKNAHTFPSVGEIETAVTASFGNLQEKPDYISFVGNGEPTLHPEFEEIVKRVIQLRDKFLPGTPITAFTNGSTLDNRHVINGLNLLDERFVKADAGNEDTFKSINEPLVRMGLQKLIAGCRKLKDVTLQCMFVNGAIDNTQDIEDWIEVVGMLKPKAIHLYTLDRVPGRSGLKRVEEETLDRIAAQLERRIKLRPKVFV